MYFRLKHKKKMMPTYLRRPLMIVKANIFSPDYVIMSDDLLEESLSTILNLSTARSSPYFIEKDYLFQRLIDCSKLAMQEEYPPLACPIIFDSWTCWNYTQPDSVALEKCPDFENWGFKQDSLAEKLCTEDGSWWVHPSTNRYSYDK